MRKRVLATVSLLATVLMGGGVQAAGPAPLGDVAQLKQAIAKTRTAYEESWRAGSADRVTALYAEDAIVLYPHQPPVIGRSAILNYFRTFFEEYLPETFALKSEEVEVAGEWAFDRGAYRLAISARRGGSRVEDHGKYLVILRRLADGSWKVARDMDNSDLPLMSPQR
jgi:uncharacterized protein (TIGR02246 family)